MRKSWEDLTPAYRRRLERAGITESSHGSANLIRARGHQASRPAGAAPEALVELAVRGQLEGPQVTDLTRFFTWPSWLPKTATRQGRKGLTFPILPEVAAALSQLPDPKRWRSVEITPRGEGEPWTMVVKLKGNAYDREILIPGGGWAGSGAKEVLEILTMIRDGYLAKRNKPRRYHPMNEALEEIDFFDVLGSEIVA